MSRNVGGDTLVLEPFRGVRFDPARVSHLGAVTSPPYDVLGSHDAAALARTDRHNIVHVILPGIEGAPDRYAAAGRTWESWLADGTLCRDEAPALYVLEQETGSHRLRGLVGCVGLRPPTSRAIVPHEDVMAGPVRDRLALLRATRANLEPILLVCDAGGSETSAAIAAAAATRPLLEAHGPYGSQRLWAIDSPDVLGRIALDLAPRSAMIADGHHRYASYRAYQQEHPVAGGLPRSGTQPWDTGLAVLVDHSTSPLTLTAIHRVVPGLSLAVATESALPRFVVEAATLGDEPARGSFLMTDGAGAVRLKPRAAADHDPGEVLDTAALHETLLPLLGVVLEPSVRYFHEATAAVAAAVESRGVAVLLAPVALATVVDMAADGLRMPRKTTSFGPKPASGIIMRSLAD